MLSVQIFNICRRTGREKKKVEQTEIKIYSDLGRIWWRGWIYFKLNVWQFRWNNSSALQFFFCKPPISTSPSLKIMMVIKVINLPDNPLHMSPELECVCTMGVSEGTSPYIIWHIHLSAHSKNSLRWWLSQLVFPQLIMNCPSTPRSVLYSGKFNIYGSLRAVGKLPKAPEQKWTAKPTFCASCSPR